MLLGFLTVIIMLACAWAFLRQGLMAAFMMCVNVVAAGLIAFNFWEPIADALDPMFADTFLNKYEDAITLTGLFGLSLMLLRLTTNYLCSSYVHFPAALQYGGGFFFSLVLGYLTCGFLLAVFQTLPWHHNFMFFEYKYEPEQAAAVVRRVLPPDRVWLALMRRAGAYTFASQPDPTPVRLLDERFPDQFLTFDKYATFPLRYTRYRRYGESGNPRPYLGEFDLELHKRR